MWGSAVGTPCPGAGQDGDRGHGDDERSRRLRHGALLYATPQDYAEQTQAFIAAARSAGDPVMVAVPRARLELIRAAAGEDVHGVAMERLGRNPGRVVAEFHDWIEGRAPARAWLICESVWPGRTAAETLEAVRHDAIIDLALHDLAANVMCPYDARALDPAVVAQVWRTHGDVIRAGRRVATDGYHAPLTVWQAAEHPLAEPGGPAARLDIGHDLAAVRRFVARRARESGLCELRQADFVLAVDEAATNAVMHGRRPATVSVWRESGRLVCEVFDRGRFTAVLAGHRRPAVDQPRGRGLWMINQVCDLVELRPTPAGTRIRLHVDLEP